MKNLAERLELESEVDTITYAKNLVIVKKTEQKIEDAKKQNKFNLIIKRLMDIVVGLVGVIALIPLTILVVIINFVNKENGPVFYKQERIGKDGKKFNIYKFRTMVTNAQEILDKMLTDENLKKEWEENRKFKNDPRITKSGKFLRKTSLDEFPQFINVLFGDMSLIGPRPLIVGELDAYNGDHELYESVKPGLSGWWAANGRSDTTYEERLELEYYYVKNWNLLLDLKCVFKTINAVLQKKGAK